MITALERAAYRLTQAARLGWFSGQSALTSRLSERVPAPPELRPAMPTAQAMAIDRLRLIARDLRNVEAGYYRLPHDMAGNPLRALRRSLHYFADLRAINRRLRGGAATAIEPAAAEAYPDYYRRGFHNQTDGYLSRRSAELYDHQVEVLFGGAADAMRRQALVPLHHFFRRRRTADCRLVDIASGTGRFLTFVKDNYPRLMVTALDISPFYLAQAAENLRSWSRVDLARAPAEATGLPAESADAVTCIYLFHELPTALHGAVAAEIARVLKPGGIFVFVDSLQPGDRPQYDALLRYFPLAFHEPYYADYLGQDLERVFAAAGLVLDGVGFAYLSRVMVLRKPAAAG